MVSCIQRCTFAMVIMKRLLYIPITFVKDQITQLQLFHCSNKLLGFLIIIFVPKKRTLGSRIYYHAVRRKYYNFDPNELQKSSKKRFPNDPFWLRKKYWLLIGTNFRCLFINNKPILVRMCCKSSKNQIFFMRKLAIRFGLLHYTWLF